MASFRPNGLLYEGRGIQPDIVMEPEPRYFIGQSDAVLEAATKTLRTNNVKSRARPTQKEALPAGEVM